MPGKPQCAIGYGLYGSMVITMVVFVYYVLQRRAAIVRWAFCGWHTLVAGHYVKDHTYSIRATLVNGCATVWIQNI